MAERRRHNRRKKRGRMNGLYRVIAVLLVLAAVGAGCVVFFRVRSIQVEGAARYTSEEIVAASGLEEGSYLALLDTVSMARQIRARLPYVERAAIRRVLPDGVVITVEESTVAVAVNSQGQWWLVNSAGKLLEVVDEAGAEGRPQLTGVELITPAPGMNAIVGQEEENRWNSALELLRALDARGELSKLSGVDCSTAGSLTARYGGRYTLLFPTSVEYQGVTEEQFAYFLDLLDQSMPQLEEGGQNLVDFTLWESTGRIHARYLP